MRIFTLGKNGIPVFLFALILFSGTYSSYGQCPTVDATDSTQFFCDIEETTFENLAVTTGTNVAWYSSQTATEPFINTQYIPDGTNTFYAGTIDGSCAGTRAEVTVTVYTAPEILGINEITRSKESTKESLPLLLFCVADVNNPDIYLTNIRTSADDTGTVQWYASQDATTPLDPATTELTDGTEYWVDQASADGSCRTSRRSVTIQINSEPVPEGPTAQSFCAVDNPTLSAIQATGTNRYYNAAGVRLSGTTPMEDGRTYYVSSVGTYCESTELLEVTVNLLETDAGRDKTEIICLAEAQQQLATVEDAQAYFISLLDTGVETDGTFDQTIEALVADFNETQQGTYRTTYTVNNDLGCPGSSNITLIVTDDPYAGAPNSLELCLAEAQSQITSVDDMRTLFFDLMEAGVDQTGSFDLPVEDLYAEFQTSPEGTFQTIYTVTSGGCEDSAEFTLNVVPDPVAGDDTIIDLCQSEVETYLANPEDLDATFSAMITNADAGGTFNPSLEDIAAQYQQDAENGNFPGQYNTIYTVAAGQTCTDTADISIIVREDPNAGEANSITYCSNDLPATQTEAEVEQIYLDLLATDVSTTGTFEPTIATITTNYNSNPIGTFTTVYTVSNEQCVDTVELSFTVEEALPADAGAATTVAFCRVDGAQNLMEYLDPATNPNGYFEEAEASAFNPSEAGVGTYTFTYTVDESSDCVSGTDSVVYTVEVTDTPAPTYVADQNVFCSYERATVTTLEAAIAEAGAVTWYTSATGAETYDADHILEDGVTYYAAITPDQECESFERLAVTPTIEVCESLIPEAFSPNGDGINDRFEITNLEQYPNYTIEIFNRYGNTVFKGNASSPAWDGTSSEGSLGDKVLPVGVYFYILNYNDGQTPPTQGRLYLSR